MRTLNVANEVLIGEVVRYIEAGHTCTIRVRGVSMRLFLEDCRDKVILAAPEDIKIGDALLVRTDENRLVLHRLILRDGDDLVLKGDGNVFGVEHCQVKDVLAKAIGFYRKGREKPDMVTGSKWRIYSWIWLRITPFRRYVLAFYRHIWLRIFPVRLPEE